MPCWTCPHLDIDDCCHSCLQFSLKVNDLWSLCHCTYECSLSIGCSPILVVSLTRLAASHNCRYKITKTNCSVRFEMGLSEAKRFCIFFKAFNVIFFPPFLSFPSLLWVSFRNLIIYPSLHPLSVHQAENSRLIQ